MSVEQQGNQQQTPEASNDVIDALSEALEPVRRSYQPATHQKRPFTLTPGDSGTTQPIPTLELVRRKNMPIVAPDGKEVEPAPFTQPFPQIAAPDGRYAFPAPITKPLPIVHQPVNVKAEVKDFLRRQAHRLKNVLPKRYKL